MRLILRLHTIFRALITIALIAQLSLRGSPQFAAVEVAADEIAGRNWPPCKGPTISIASSHIPPHEVYVASFAAAVLRQLPTAHVTSRCAARQLRMQSVGSDVSPWPWSLRPKSKSLALAKAKDHFQLSRCRIGQMLSCYTPVSITYTTALQVS